jgi:hypothetical protein
MVTVAVAVGASLPLEAAPPPGFALVARTRRVSYFSQRRLPVDVRRSESFLDRLETVFGAAPPGWRVEYHRHASQVDIRDHTGLYALGVTDLARAEVDSVWSYHPHELVHVVAGRVARPPTFFAEGLAVALSSGGRWGERTVDAVAREAIESGHRLDPFITAFAEQDPELGYPLAGSFVAFLIDGYGIDRVLAFYGAYSTPLSLEAAFREAFGHTSAHLTLAWTLALSEGKTQRWSWADPDTWPHSLRRPVRGETPALRAAAAVDARPEGPGQLDRGTETLLSPAR